MNFEQFLTCSGLLHLKEHLNMQSIDSVEILQLLSEAEIKELITTIGDRAKLRRGILLLQSQSEDRNKLLLTPVALTQIEEYKDANSSTRNSDSTLKSNLRATQSSHPITTDIECDESSTSTATDLDNSNCGLNSSFLSTTSDLGDFSLRNILECDIISRTILQKAQNNILLENSDRNQICELIITHFLNRGTKLNNNSIAKIADEICVLFPTERRAIYFVSPVSKKSSKFHKPQVARGKLIDKHRNKLTQLRRSLNLTEASPRGEHFEGPPLVSQESKDSKIWLMVNREPLEDVLYHWKTSYELRKLVDHKDIKIQEFLEEWPILKTQIAVDLIGYDFSECFKIPSDTETLFEDFFESVLQKRRRYLSAADETVLNLLNEDLTTDSKNGIRLYLLPALIPPKGRTRIATDKHWKPSIAECREGYLVHVKIPGDVEKAKKEKIDRHFRRGMTVQPYILLVGPNLNNIVSSHVVIDDNIFKTQSVLAAVDFCFKAHHVLDAKYTFESQHVWYLLQRNIYKIVTKYDIKIPFVQDLI